MVDSFGFLMVEITAFVSRAVSKLYPADGLRPKLDRRETRPRVSRVLAPAIYSLALCLLGCRKAGEPSFAVDSVPSRRSRERCPRETPLSPARVAIYFDNPLAADRFLTVGNAARSKSVMRRLVSTGAGGTRIAWLVAIRSGFTTPRSAAGVAKLIDAAHYHCAGILMP